MSPLQPDVLTRLTPPAVRHITILEAAVSCLRASIQARRVAGSMAALGAAQAMELLLEPMLHGSPPYELSTSTEALRFTEALFKPLRVPAIARDQYEGALRELHAEMDRLLDLDLRVGSQNEV